MDHLPLKKTKKNLWAIVKGRIEGKASREQKELWDKVRRGDVSGEILQDGCMVLNKDNKPCCRM